jgi:hypothetical protein
MPRNSGLSLHRNKRARRIDLAGFLFAPREPALPSCSWKLLKSERCCDQARFVLNPQNQHRSIPMKLSGLDMNGAVLAAAMLIGPLALAPAYGPFVPNGTAQKVNEATTGEPNPLNQPAVIN